MKQKIIKFTDEVFYSLINQQSKNSNNWDFNWDLKQILEDIRNRKCAIFHNKEEDKRIELKEVLDFVFPGDSSECTTGQTKYYFGHSYRFGDWSCSDSLSSDFSYTMRRDKLFLLIQSSKQ